MANKSVYFPEEIWYQILLCLPSKTLSRFLTICKLFHKSITSEAFISSHLNQNLATERNTHLLFRVFDYKNNAEEYLFYPYNQPKLRIKKSLEGPFLFLNPPAKSISSYARGKSPCYRVIGSCNGLVCLMDCFYYHGSGILLWNPSIQKYVPLPNPSIYGDHGAIITRYVFGFGMSLLDNDFKVVRIGYSTMFSTIGQVYSLRRGKWRESNGLSSNYYTIVYDRHAYLNGCCHWIGHRRESLEWLMIVFDVGDEMCREILLPKRLLLDKEKNALQLTTIPREKECLAIVYKVGAGDRRMSYRVWVMSEYGVPESWNKLYDIDLGSSMQGAWFVGFMKNDVMLMRMNSIQFVCYYPEDESLKDLKIFDAAPSAYAHRYVESLVLLE